MIKQKIKLGQTISLEDIFSWPAASMRDGGEIAFVLSKNCSFEPGSEGTALSYLTGLVQNRAAVLLYCDFELPSTVKEFYSSILSSLFGYALIRYCQAVFFGRSRSDYRSELRVLSGKLYDQYEGIVGLGDEVRLIAFDPRRPIPKALLKAPESIDKQGLPLPSAFHSDVLRILGRMGLSEIASPTTLSTIIRFVHELFVNTCQHGRPNDELIARYSTRGISLSKIVLNLSQLGSRRVSADLREYLERVAEMQKHQTTLQVVCLSVMDMGDGIQNTLPPVNEVETDGERLLRAFRLGESRKTKGAIERGAGLDRVVKVAHRLGARLQVSSAGKRLIKDFSLGEDKLPDINNAIPVALPEHIRAGTCIDLFVPGFPSDIDQRSLNI